LLLSISKRIVLFQPRPFFLSVGKSSTTYSYAEFNAIQTEKRTSYRNKVKATKGDPDKSGVAAGDNSTLADDSINGKAAAAGDDTDMIDVTADLDKGDSSAPRTKKPRVDGVETEEEDDDEEEDAEDVDDEVEEDDPEQDGDEDDDEEDDENDGGSGDETQDALEEKDKGEDRDEALDGDDSD
jgi:DNA polymerase epsilon subunit 3